MSLESCIESAKNYTCPMTLMLETPKKCIANECNNWKYHKEVLALCIPLKTSRSFGISIPGKPEFWKCGFKS